MMKDLLRELESLDESDLVARIAASPDLSDMQKALWVIHVKASRELELILREHKKNEEAWQTRILELVMGEELEGGLRRPGLKDLIPLIDGLEKMAKAYDGVTRIRGILLWIGVGGSAWWVYASGALKELRAFLIKLLQ